MLLMIHGDGEDMAEVSDDGEDAPKNGTVSRRDGDFDYWLPGVAAKGVMPLAEDGYQFYRNVQDFGAVGDGRTDDTVAINRAVAAFNKDNHKKTRCGKECGSTTTMQALVYFPTGTYLISSPIIQFYHTQFVGDVGTMPVLKGAKNFSGIALVDNDPYIPAGNGAEWYINQSNFLRQIRNMVFDLTEMKNRNTQGIQRYVPTGIHWQVGQATSIFNCVFRMPVASDDVKTTAVGIFMENGSGGTMGELDFIGGNIGLIAGSQQFTATGIRFHSCLTGIQQLWNWGFVYKNLEMYDCGVGLDCTSYSDATKQGVGSIALIDAVFKNTKKPITVGSDANRRPGIVLDNVDMRASGAPVSVPGGETLLDGGSSKIDQWVSGYEVLPGEETGSKRSGNIKPQHKRPEKLVDDDGNYFYRPKPTYDNVKKVFVVTDMGVKNDGTGDQTEAINKVLADRQIGEVTYFPAGIYQVKGTVKVPVNAAIVGSSWSQIRGTGSYFEDEDNPKVMVQVGERGSFGRVEISDMIFTVKGPTAGCILMEWNIEEGGFQGQAAMWDSHFRVGGAEGSYLQYADCPAKAGSIDKKCKAASIMMHMTPNSSGFFDNVWLWVADHDLDNPANAETYETDDGIPRNTKTQVSVYSARGMLVESKGPTWFYGTSSEHSQMYQYQLQGASNIFFGHMQTETPYYQPNPTASGPYLPGKFRADPTFLNCEGDKLCETSWALRILHSKDVVVYGGGFYSFFKDNELGCTETEDCQKSMIETSYSEGIWLYNIFTKGNQEIITPAGDHFKPLKYDKSTKNGYTSEIAAWLPLALDGGQYGDEDISAGNDGDGGNNIDDRPVCDLSRKFDSLEALANADDLDSMCRALLAFPLLMDKLDKIWAEYNEVNKGYDDLFKFYAKYFPTVANEEISNCTRENDNLFQCRNYDKPWGSCKEFYENHGNDPLYRVTYKCLDKHKYESILEDQYAINHTWVVYENGRYDDPCHLPPGSHDHGCLDYHQSWFGKPALADKIDVPDPKEVVLTAGENFDVIRSKLVATYADIITTQWSGSYEDAIDIFSAPVTVLAQAVQTMKDTKKTAEEIKDEERNNELMNIFGIVFMLLPFVGELLGPFGGVVAMIGRIISTIGTAGDLAVNLQSIVQDPETAPMVLIGVLAGVTGSGIARSAKGYKPLKQSKATMDSGGVFTKFGKLSKENNDVINKLVARCA